MAALHARAREWFGGYCGDGEWAPDDVEIQEEAAYAAADAARNQGT